MSSSLAHGDVAERGSLRLLFRDTNTTETLLDEPGECLGVDSGKPIFTEQHAPSVVYALLFCYAWYS
jgi:hypothetical protein